jgi:transposase
MRQFQTETLPVTCPAWIYNNRNLVERLWGRLRERRAVATRYEKTGASFLGVLCLAAALDWIKPQQALETFCERAEPWFWRACGA